MKNKFYIYRDGKAEHVSRKYFKMWIGAKAYHIEVQTDTDYDSMKAIALYYDTNKILVARMEVLLYE